MEFCQLQILSQLYHLDLSFILSFCAAKWHQYVALRVVYLYCGKIMEDIVLQRRSWHFWGPCALRMVNIDMPHSCGGP